MPINALQNRMRGLRENLHHRMGFRTFNISKSGILSVKAIRNGMPYKGVSVTLTNVSAPTIPNQFPVVITNQDGIAIFNLPSGSYNVLIFTPGSSSWISRGIANVIEGQTTNFVVDFVFADPNKTIRPQNSNLS